jgi:hypothetical protein
VKFFDLRDLLKGNGDFGETLIACNLGKVGIDGCPFQIFSSGSFLQVCPGIADYACRVAGCNLHVSSLKVIEKNLGVFFFIISGFEKKSGNLFVAFFFGFACKISVPVSAWDSPANAFRRFFSVLVPLMLFPIQFSSQ